MVVYLGSNELQKAYLGNTEIKEIRVGSHKVFPSRKAKYQQVEYIWRNGNNYIDTLRIPKPTVAFEVRIWYKISTSWVRYWVVSNYSSNAYNWEVSLEVNAWGITNNTARFYFQNSSYWATNDLFSNTGLSTSNFNDIIYKNNTWGNVSVSVNWNTRTGSVTNPNQYQNYSAYLFIDRALRWSTFSYNSFVSYLKIYENNVLIRDMVPVYRKSDNVIGMYDILNDVFYTNKWSGTFSKWWNVN